MPGTRQQRPLLCTLMLILLIAAASFLASRHINRMEAQLSLDTLYRESENLAREIENQVASDRMQLDMLARTAASFADLRAHALWAILDAHATVGMMSDLFLLLPDGTVLPGRTQERRADASLSFRDIAARGAHISERSVSPATGDPVLLHHVPVVRDGKTVAILCGEVDLGKMPNRLVFSPYGGKAILFVLDADTGDFLLDTWHSSLGSLKTLGSRTMAPGYSFPKFIQDLADAATGHVIMLSKTSGSYFYLHYRPLLTNQWRLVLGVSQTLVFENANRIRTILNILLLLEGACFFLYFIWIFRHIRRKTGEKQRQLDTINNVYDVAKLLFGAHEHQENIAPALERIARNTGSSAAVFWVAGLGENGLAFSWRAGREAGASNGMPTQAAVPGYIPMLVGLFRKGEPFFEVHHPTGLSSVFPKAFPKDVFGGLTGMAAIPLEDAKGLPCGLLAVENPRMEQDTHALLRSVSFSFRMLGQNLHHLSAIRARGETDALTGLWNRNRYERDLPEYRQWYQDSLACVYIDANGLHELNNTRGHEAGDHMLRSIAGEILHCFGKAHSYRIGGDEFVAFVADRTGDAVSGLCREMKRALMDRNIHVSLGCQWAADTADIQAFIKAAEQEMFADKRSYYAHRAHDRRHAPR